MAKNTKPTARNELSALLGASFRKRREEAGFSLAATAAALGVGVNTVRWHEGGEMMLRADKLLMASVLFQIEPGLLFYYPPEPTAEETA